MNHLRLVLAAVAESIPLTSRQVAEKVGIDYRRNFNKREARYGRRLAEFIVRRRLTPDEIANWPADETPSHRKLHWIVADAWQGQAIDDILAAFDVSERAKDELRSREPLVPSVPPLPEAAASEVAIV